VGEAIRSSSAGRPTQHAISGLVRVLPKVGQYGRLPGFTNQQIEANRAGRKPYVIAHEATGKVAPAAQPYVAAIEQHLRELAATKQQQQVAAEVARRAQHRDRGPSR
jgi:hypothetical protein